MTMREEHTFKYHTRTTNYCIITADSLAVAALSIPRAVILAPMQMIWPDVKGANKCARENIAVILN